MPALTITAVDNTTEQISITAHGLNTGDGPAAVYVPAGGVIPGGLAPVTSYWVIRVDANTIKLATSSANALANSPINITSNGTLPLQLVIGLPYCVPRTAAPNTQAFSADANNTWLALVALWNFLTGQAQAIWSGIVLAANQNITLSGTGDYKHGNKTLLIHASEIQSNAGVYGFAAGGLWGASTGAGSLICGIPLRAGDRIQSLTFEAKGNAVVNITLAEIELWAVGGAGGAPTNLASTTVNAVPASWNDTVLTVGSPVATPNSSTADLRINFNGAGLQIAGIRVVYDRP